ncbi:MAG TPA: GYD domain-containing protein [Acidimicrobiales bacterium]|nr:GYD domain-containing protein [Acidimicrobiales bacterium]
MPKYLIEAAYTAEGAKGLLDKGGSARRKAVEEATKSVGGRVEAFYFAFGTTDVVAILDLPDQASMAALALTVSASGMIETAATVLLTPEELDEASKKSTKFSPPGS